MWIFSFFIFENLCVGRYSMCVFVGFPCLIWHNWNRNKTKQTSIYNFVYVCLCSGETKDDRQAGGHQFAPEGWDGPLQEDDGQAETEQTPVPEREGSHAGGGRDYFMQSDTHKHTQSELFFVVLLTLLPLSLSLSSLSHCSNVSWHTYTYKTLHLHYITLRICPFFCVADRGLASRAGAFAALQAGGREAWPQPQLFL